MKKIKLILSLLIIVLLIACSNDAGNDLDVKVMTTPELFEPEEGITDQKEMNEKFNERVELIKDSINSMSLDEIKENITERFKEVLSKSDTEILKNNYSLTIEENKYLLAERIGYPAFNNLDVVIEFEGIDVLSEDEAEEVKLALINPVTGYFKINSMDINGTILMHVENRYRVEGTIFDYEVDETEEEKGLRKVAFDFAEEFNETVFGLEKYWPRSNVTLRHFGIDKEAKELYIEIAIYEDEDIEDVDSFIKSLEVKGQELLDKLSEDMNFGYLTDSDINKIKIDYYLPWNSDADHIYFDFDI